MAFTMIFNSESFSASRGVKGEDYVRLFDDENNVVFEATGVSDFSVFEVTEGSWQSPVTQLVSTVTAGASMSAGAIRLTIPSDVRATSGLSVNFKTPCDCTAVTSGLVIDGNTYEVVDAVGNVMTGGSGGVWSAGALVTVTLDVESKKAYLQNPAATKGSTSECRTYTGTGAGGSNTVYSSKITFDFQPRLVTITGATGETCTFNVGALSVELMATAHFWKSTGTSVEYCESYVTPVTYKVTKSGDTYTLNMKTIIEANRATHVFNESDKTYYVTAIG